MKYAKRTFWRAIHASAIRKRARMATDNEPWPCLESAALSRSTSTGLFPLVSRPRLASSARSSTTFSLAGSIVESRTCECQRENRRLPAEESLRRALSTRHFDGSVARHLRQCERGVPSTVAKRASAAMCAFYFLTRLTRNMLLPFVAVAYFVRVGFYMYILFG